MKNLFCLFLLFIASSSSVFAEDWVRCTSILPPPPYIDTYVENKYGKSWYVKDFFVDKSRIYTNGKGYYTIYTKTINDDGTYSIAQNVYDFKLDIKRFVWIKYYNADGSMYKEVGGEGWRKTPEMSIAEYKFDCVKKLAGYNK